MTDTDDGDVPTRTGPVAITDSVDPFRDDPRPYRPCVGLMLFNNKGEVFIGNRIDVPGDHWQMPQGGIDDGETPLDAALRELQEEIGTNKATVLAESATWYPYDLPAGLSRRIWKGKYRGQTQRWFALRFLGTDEDIDLTSHKPEFGEWRWVDIQALPDLIVPFKRPIYERVLAEFADLAHP
ncbi:MAG TPA: RNA pyrophosphohydrolase [Rhodospirillaceae bacterium]|nr:RNA pyrophosphohydrolase [Rhodospirillaceae bacterium]MAX64531.1 RNA pyrophosphohydrolase [Rhodospirillaceae bacterium]MBB58439.1 RNA pyrophosphohydrolase [Rhodospirillaceae bacterium]HAJ22741.1 RNA pyrophosphohydrolase [Rhodospirillaceae bacterium]|tara:strand:+ start:22574 stop:23119 length:546 start_codon:yes stop_codon:yes gene_type:complete